MNLKQVLDNAERAADSAALVSLAVPEDADEFFAYVEIPACLRVDKAVSADEIGSLALDFGAEIRERMVDSVGAKVVEKLHIEYLGASGGTYHAYRGEVFVFTRAELKELVNDAMRAGRLTAQ